jgi:SnoaL-like domain
VLAFLGTFERLDLAAFAACFADDATAFFPTPEPAERFDGKEAVVGHFAQVFAAIQAHATGGPPYHRLVPLRLQLDLMGDGGAVATFELQNEERLARRTLVLRKEGGALRIVHLHASNVALR